MQLRFQISWVFVVVFPLLEFPDSQTSGISFKGTRAEKYKYTRGLNVKTFKVISGFLFSFKLANELVGNERVVNVNLTVGGQCGGYGMTGSHQDGKPLLQFGHA